jgi:serine/threonine protein kinase
MAQAGAVLGGRYVLDEQIGNGGFGEVWRAADTVLSRSVAIKLMHLRHAGQGEAVARFRAEARYAAALSHENIAQVYDYGEAAGGQPPYLVMELVTGTSLEAALADGPLDAAGTMDIVSQTAAGLRAAHAAGMVHRDVKPGNLLLSSAGTVKITDFGIAHTVGSAAVTATGELLGTPAYVAPERVMGERAGPASDLYSLGIVAYECLAGARPFTGTPLDVALAHRDRPLPPLPYAVADDVTAFVMRLTAKDPARRLGDAAEVAVRAALLRDRTGNGSAAVRRSRGSVPPDRDWARRRAVLAYAGAALAAVIVIVVASVIGFASPNRSATATPAPTSTSALSPSSASRDSNIAAPPSSRSAARTTRPTATSTARTTAANPAAHHRPAAVAPVVVKAVVPGPGEGDGNGNGNGNGPWRGKGPGNGHGSGNGPWRGKGPGDGNGPGRGNGPGNGNRPGNGNGWYGENVRAAVPATRLYWS